MVTVGEIVFKTPRVYLGSFPPQETDGMERVLP